MSKELVDLYQNVIFVCISQYYKNWQFLVKNADTSKGVSHNLYTFWIFFKWGMMTVPHIIIVGYV